MWASWQGVWRKVHIPLVTFSEDDIQPSKDTLPQAKKTKRLCNGSLSGRRIRRKVMILFVQEQPAQMVWHSREPGDLRSFYTPAPMADMKTTGSPYTSRLCCCCLSSAGAGVRKQFRVTLRGWEMGVGWKEEEGEKIKWFCWQNDFMRAEHNELKNPSASQQPGSIPQTAGLSIWSTDGWRESVSEELGFWRVVSVWGLAGRAVWPCQLTELLGTAWEWALRACRPPGGRGQFFVNQRCRTVVAGRLELGCGNGRRWNGSSTWVSASGPNWCWSCLPERRSPPWALKYRVVLELPCVLKGERLRMYFCYFQPSCQSHRVFLSCCSMDVFQLGSSFSLCELKSALR